MCFSTDHLNLNTYRLKFGRDNIIPIRHAKDRNSELTTIKGNGPEVYQDRIVFFLTNIYSSGTVF
jgi:hypothetical protein